MMSEAEQLLLQDALKLIDSAITTLVASNHPGLAKVAGVLHAAVLVGEQLL